jgi:hypothetical protein
MDPCHDLQASQPVRIPDEHWTGTPKEMHERADKIMRAFGPVRHPLYLHRIKNVETSSPYIADPALRPSRGPAGQ